MMAAVVVLADEPVQSVLDGPPVTNQRYRQFYIFFYMEILKVDIETTDQAIIDLMEGKCYFFNISIYLRGDF